MTTPSTTNTAPNSGKDRVFIFDTTMRDGEQSPGASMTLREKLELAELLQEMKVDLENLNEAKTKMNDEIQSATKMLCVHQFDSIVWNSSRHSACRDIATAEKDAAVIKATQSRVDRLSAQYNGLRGRMLSSGSSIEEW